MAGSRGILRGSGPSQGGRPWQGSMWRPTFRTWNVTTGKPPLDTAELDLDRDSSSGKPGLRGVGEKIEFFSQKLRPHFKFLKRSFAPLNTQENICGIQTPSCSRSFLTVFFVAVLEADRRPSLSPAALGARAALHRAGALTLPRTGRRSSLPRLWAREHPSPGGGPPPPRTTREARPAPAAFGAGAALQRAVAHHHLE